MLPAPIVLSLPVADRRRSYDFYTRGLGLDTEGAPGDDGVPEPLSVVVNDALRVMLIPTGGFGWTVGDREVAAAGTVECQLTVPYAVTRDVDAFAERAVDAGAELVLPAEQRPWGYCATISDPDGHLWSALVPG